MSFCCRSPSLASSPWPAPCCSWPATSTSRSAPSPSWPVVVLGELTADRWAASAGLPGVPCWSGLGWGLATGYLVAYLGFSPVVVTLGGLAGARGVAEILSKGITKYGFGPGFAELGNGEFLGIDTPVWLFLAVFLLGSYVWYQSPSVATSSRSGRSGSPPHSLGVATRRIPFLLYGASGLAAALGGLIVTSQLDAVVSLHRHQPRAVGPLRHPPRRRLLHRWPRLALRRAHRRALHRRARQRAGADERRPLLPARRRRAGPGPRRGARRPLPAARPHPGGRGAGPAAGSAPWRRRRDERRERADV